jgi:PTH1 family peptidyl-tRNA hydrolase
MKLIIGLGNPGKQYEKTRHNAGFMAIEELRKKNDFPNFSLNKKFNAEISEGVLKNEKVILAKPQAFMNRSGQVVRTILDFYKLSANDIVVIHDDLDIDLGTYKISTDASAGGHNGVQSIIDSLGTQEFKRIRIGIEGTERKKNRTMAGEAFVLQDFSGEEKQAILPALEEILKNI